MKRRDFIKTTAAVAASSAILPAFSMAENRKIGLQLWTVRDIIKQDVAGTLKKIADLGYKELETFSYEDGNLFGMKSKDFGALAKSNGLKVVSGHYQTGITNPATKGTLTNDWERASADAKELGQEFMIVAYLHEAERKTLDDYKRVCELTNKASEVCRKNGMRIGYHNHNFEFDKIDGQIPYDLMLKELKADVTMEMDLYWIIRAGYNPVDYFAKYPGRFEQWHIKDMSKTDNTKNVNVGDGSIDFKPFFSKAKEAGLKHFYVEHDTFPGTPMESVAADIKSLKTWM